MVRKKARKKMGRKHPRPKSRKSIKRSKKSKSRIIQKKERKASNILNIGKLMRKYSDGMNVSPSAVHAMTDRIDLFLELATPQITEIAKAHGCKKIKECENLEHPEKGQVHITWFFSLSKNKIDNIAHLKGRYHWELVKNNKSNEE